MPAGRRDRAPESALAGYLDEARALLEAAPAWHDGTSLASGQEGEDRDPSEVGAVSAAFEHLRWFDLPAASLLQR